MMQILPFAPILYKIEWDLTSKITNSINWIGFSHLIRWGQKTHFIKVGVHSNAVSLIRRVKLPL